MAAQDPRHRPGRHTELGAEPVLAAAMLALEPRAPLLRLAGVVRVGIRCGRDDRSTRPASPSASKRATHRCAHWREIAHRLGDMRDRHALLTDAVHQQTTTMHGQTGVTVRHEDLRVVETAIPTAPGGLHSRQRTVTNVLAGYN